MNKINNSYLYNQVTQKKSKSKNNNELVSIPKCIYDYKRNNNYVQSHLGQTFYKYELLNKYINYKNSNEKTLYTSLNKMNISSHKNNNCSLYLNDIVVKKNKILVKNQKEIINNDIQSNNYYNKKRKYQRCNSLAYTKKRPNDLIKFQNSDNNNNSNIYNQYLINCDKIKGRCLSYNNLKNTYNLINNDDIEGNGNDNNLSKKIMPFSYPFESKIEKIERKTKKFSVIQRNKNMFINIIINVIKKYLISNKIIFFKQLCKKNNIYEVSFEEYKFLEELKALGVTNKKELNLLLKDIYISIKGNNGINKNENIK